LGSRQVEHSRKLIAFSLFLVLIGLLVDKGPFAQHNAASVFSDAAFLGEKTRYLNQAEIMIPRSTPAALLSALKDFFKDNPDWD
jgi:hypothetical protein